jgi:non-heme chloroperoxidase
VGEADHGPFKSGQIALKDGVRLAYLEAGQGAPLLMVPGWSQTAIQFKHQLTGLSDRYRVIAFDPRGHGESDKPDHGYHLARMAMDLREVIDALDLDGAAVLGHSLGATTIWCFWDLFGGHRASKFIFVDQPPYFVERPYAVELAWERAPASLTMDQLRDTTRDIGGPNGAEATRTLLAGMVSPEMTKADFDWLVERNLRLPRGYAARLLYNGASSDWRGTIPHIGLPTLIISGRGSITPWQSQLWIHEQIPGSQIAFVEAKDRGQHFMFMENPEEFNRIVAGYLAE